MKHDPKVKIFYSDRYFYILQEICHNVCRCLLPWWNKVFYFDISLRYPTLEVQYSKILSGESILLAKSKEYTLFYIPDKFQGVWMTKLFRRSVFDRSLNRGLGKKI